jgi:hypothetical protein
MAYIRKFEGAGRVVLSNGARMSYQAFRESMAEMFPAPSQPQSRQDSADLEELAEEVGNLKEQFSHFERRVEPALALKRAQRDKASGRLFNETPATVTHHSAEGELWK